jgi:hypothetical protein
MRGSPTAPAGVRTVDAESFDVVLKIGTQEAIEKWAGVYKLDLNTRCIAYDAVSGRMGIQYLYPLEHVMHRYYGAQSLEKLLCILMALKVPIEGYHDYSPQTHARGAKLGQRVMDVLFNLSTSPEASGGSTVPSSQNKSAAQPQINTNARNVTEQNAQVSQDQSHKPRMFTTQQVIIISAVSMLCGVGIKTVYDWYVGRVDEDTDAKQLNSEVI